MACDVQSRTTNSRNRRVASSLMSTNYSWAWLPRFPQTSFRPSRPWALITMWLSSLTKRSRSTAAVPEQSRAKQGTDSQQITNLRLRILQVTEWRRNGRVWNGGGRGSGNMTKKTAAEQLYEFRGVLVESMVIACGRDYGMASRNLGISVLYG
jgi:hypothetical protein